MASIARKGAGRAWQPDFFASASTPDTQPASDAILTEKLRTIDPDGLTPKQALEMLYTLKRLVT